MNQESMKNRRIDPEMTVSELLERWPETIPVFLSYHTACVGCSMSSFETLTEAASIYKIPLPVFLKELEGMIVNRGGS